MQIEELTEKLRMAHRVTVLTGAGVSATSGVPNLPRRGRHVEAVQAQATRNAALRGAYTAEINVEETEASASVDPATLAPAEEALRELELKI